MTTTRHPAGARRRPPRQPDTGRPATARVPLSRLFTAENRNYYLLLGVTLFLVAFGLVMVLSSSFVTEISSDSSPFGVFLRQSLYAIIGIPLLLVASRMPPRFWKRWAWPALLVGGALQLLVFIPGIGWGYGGNQNWISIGGVNAQPSEFVKIALIVWIAWVLSAKQDLLGDWKHVALPIAPVAGIAILFVLIGNDLGTAMIMVLIVLGCLFFAGVRLRFLAVAVLGLAVLGAMFAMASSSRSSRISTWLNGCTEQDYSGTCWQVLHGTWALANGGLFGVGLGNSKATWNWLPHAESDFIFAIIGEELGLVGATVVLILFVVLAIAFVRIIRGTRDSFSRITTAGVMVWVIGQAFVNIAVVLGVLPVLGVPLPLISAGGSALIANLLGIGIVLSLARHPDPERDSEVVAPAFGARLLPTDGVRGR
ncbi:MAG: putative lipid II flippase FtsW [Rhodoglobus sp.]|jgi:cell division protein FtsW|nr:putative lipid II flippase FtsW [Rhodoglobus sp.]